LKASPRFVEAEAALTKGEIERRKPLTAAEKRKRNETLAIGISRTELLKQTDSSKIGKEVPKYGDPMNGNTTLGISSIDQKEDEHNHTHPVPCELTTTPIKGLAASLKELTPPSTREPIPPTLSDASPSPPRETTPPPPRQPTSPPPREPSPPPRALTPPTKEPLPAPIEPMQPLEELTHPSTREPIPPPPRDASPSPPREPTPPPAREPTSPPPREPTPPPRALTPPTKEPLPAPIEPMQPLTESMPLKEPSLPPRETTKSHKKSTSPQKEPNQLQKEATPPMKEPNPPSKEPTPPVKELIPSIDPKPTVREPTPPLGETFFTSKVVLSPLEEPTSSPQETNDQPEFTPHETLTEPQIEDYPVLSEVAPIPEVSNLPSKDSSLEASVNYEPVPYEDVVIVNKTIALNGITIETTESNLNEEFLDIQESYSLTNNAEHDEDQAILESVENKTLFSLCGKSIPMGGVSEASNLDYGPLNDEKSVVIEQVCDADGNVVQSEYVVEEIEVDEEEVAEN